MGVYPITVVPRSGQEHKQDISEGFSDVIFDHRFINSDMLTQWCGDSTKEILFVIQGCLSVPFHFFCILCPTVPLTGLYTDGSDKGSADE